MCSQNGRGMGACIPGPSTNSYRASCLTESAARCREGRHGHRHVIPVCMLLKHRCMHAHPGICTRASTSRPAQIPMSVSCMVLRFFCTVCMWLVLTMSSKNNSCGDQAGRRPPRQARTENKVRPRHRHAHRGCNTQKCTHTHTHACSQSRSHSHKHMQFSAPHAPSPLRQRGQFPWRNSSSYPGSSA